MDNMNPISAMQAAVDIVNTSPHPSNKIAASLFHEQEDWLISSTNYWPEIIQQNFFPEEKIGNASGTIHAEIACLFTAAFQEYRATENTSLCVTDPFCPNCAKNLAEAGITTIYIDHKGFDKDFAQRRGDHFENMSMRIAEKAGINLYEIHRKDQRIVPISLAAHDYRPINKNPALVLESEELRALDLLNETSLTPHSPLIRLAEQRFPETRFAVAWGHKRNARQVAVISPAHPAIGFEHVIPDQDLRTKQPKYSFLQEPCNRLLSVMVRYGLRISNKEVFSTQTPTSREQINMIGAGISYLIIRDFNTFRDRSGLEALEQLARKNILKLYFSPQNSLE